MMQRNQASPLFTAGPEKKQPLCNKQNYKVVQDTNDGMFETLLKAAVQIPVHYRECAVMFSRMQHSTFPAWLIPWW